MKIFTSLSTLLLAAILWTTPLLAANYYVDATSGKDSNGGMSPSAPWRTIAKVNASSFSPGDSIHFRCGAVWREQLNIMVSGSSDNPITFSKYGTGPNPLIKSTEIFNSWTLVENNVYRGKIDGFKRYFGMLNTERNARVPAYISKVPYSSWIDGYFFGYNYNEDGYFYFRSTIKIPEDREIGVRQYGIYINNTSYITIDNIDVYGPNGATSTDKKSFDCGAIVINNSAYITIRNSNIKYAKSPGIWVTGSVSTNSVIENCNLDNCGYGIGFIYAGPKHRVSRCTITNIGTVDGDTGDRCFIGNAATDYVTVEDCYMDTQGNKAGEDEDSYTDPQGDHAGEHIDPGITFCCGAGYGIVRRCYIKNSARSAIGIGETDQSPDSYFYFYSNIIDRWGERFGDLSRNRSGIYLGGGDRNNFPFSANVKVYNNLIMNGPTHKGLNSRDAAISVDGYDFGEILLSNNIILYTNEAYALFFNPRSYTKREIMDNCIYSDSDAAINIYGTLYSYDKIGCQEEDCLQKQSRDYINDNFNQNPNLIWINGKPNIDKNSPCIDSGITVGIIEDYYGNPIPSGNGVDIGPFEFQVGIPPVTQSNPTGLKILRIN